jgi:hypothetical protein
MPSRSREEVLAYAEGAYTLMRARGHLENRGAERACIRLLESLLEKSEREFFNPAISAHPTGAPEVSSKKRRKREASRRATAKSPLGVDRALPGVANRQRRD